MMMARRGGLRLLGSLLVLTLALVGSVAEGQTDLASAAKRERKVVVYGSMESDGFEVIQKIYEGTYGVQVDYWRAASNRVTDRVLTEARAGEFVLVPGVYPPIKDADKLRSLMMDDLDDQELRQFKDDFGRFFVRR